MEKERELLDEVAAKEGTDGTAGGEAGDKERMTGNPGKKRKSRKGGKVPEPEAAAPESRQAPDQEATAPEGGQAPDQEAAEPEGGTRSTRYFIMTTCIALNIRSGAGMSHSVVGTIREKDGRKNRYAIVEEKDGWGRLGSGAGWICLAYTRRVS